MTSDEQKIANDLLPMHCQTCEQNFGAEIIVCPADATVLLQIETSLIGKVFANRYEIVSIIGEGGMGTVYKAKHRLMKRMIAIKVVHTHLVSNTGTLTRFQQEAEAASSLNHPNIVTVHDFGLAPRAYMVMDYLDGVSLATLLENNAHLSVDRSLPIFIQICAGLAHAHKFGVVHRDLKPSNIMLVNRDEQKDNVKIVDFGIAKLMLREVSAKSKQLTATGETFGSPLYMSPEQCRGRAIDARSDVYSLGCVMYRTLTGHQPILGQDLLECYYNHVNLSPRRFKDICPDIAIPEALEAIVIKCMEKDPKKRFQSMLELKEVLEIIDRKAKDTNANLAPLIVSVQNSQTGKVIQTGVAAGTAEEGMAATVNEAGRAANAAEAGRAATAAEFGRAASAHEAGRAAGAAEAERAAAAAESERATSAKEAGRATAAKEAERAIAAKEAARSATAAEAGRVASVAEAGLAASAVESERAATFAEFKRAAAATEPGNKASADELSISAANAEYARAAEAAESARAATAAEFTRAASAVEAGLAASATEAAFVASAREAALVAFAVEAGLAASAVEAGLVAFAVEAGLAASALEAGLAASAAEAGRAASAAEAGRVASAAAQEQQATTHAGNEDVLVDKSED